MSTDTDLPFLRADDPARAAAQAFDSRVHAAMAPLFSGLSPIALALAFTDWSLHLATQPAQSARLLASAQQSALQWWGETLGSAAPEPRDLRFRDPAWQQWPWAAMANAHHAAERWWSDATALRGMSGHHQDMTRFFARQWLDMLAPTNAGLLNPEVLQRTRERLGGNLVQGAMNAFDDWRRDHGLPPLQAATAAFRPGQEVALTPGQVVHRNHLSELIQYLPTTARVQAEPIFIVPSWIMKYYILDLSPHNSMVRWLVDQGHTVYIVSWRNPDESDALLGLEDYLEQGVFDSLAAIRRQIGEVPVHAAGYCLGGTLLSIAAAALARPGQVRGAEIGRAHV